MNARTALLTTLLTLEDCLLMPALVDGAPHDSEHNRRAAMLRQGQAVLIFSAMESFIRNRTAEILQSFDSNVVNFSGLSEDLQKAVTIGAIDGISVRLKAQDKAIQVAWLMNEVSAVASAATSPYTFSRYSFCHAKSNINEDDVVNILKAFGVESVWRSIGALASRSGSTLPDARAEFVAVKKRRHSSAHAVSGTVPHADLEQSISSVRVICLAFDLLISKSLSLANTSAFPGVGSQGKLTDDHIDLIFSEPRGVKFAVLKETRPPPYPVIRRPTIRVLGDSASAENYALGYAAERGASLIVKSISGRPASWTPCS
ncbi:HEPN domain-containing protein [uncultured Xanthomonas sp.]|uniref:HEPN domain-containing protein n=1 Tax=uncultured Xanthomonas sp. TaxID=152831 RepID=UPI0025ECAF81|nr:HEPN domain-containing protein [uncultured Xanthomonas sp.]